MYLGIDIGSTTIKTVLCDRNGGILYSDYRRHNTDITATAAAIRTELHPRIIGIVGEIYVKYNSFSNKDVVRWLNSHGIETAVPSVYNFFISAFANRHINKREHIKKLQTPLWATDALYLWMRRCARAFDRACSPCPGYRPFSDVFEDAAKASRIVSLAGD